MLTKLLFGECGAHTGERSLLLLTPCYFVPALTLHNRDPERSRLTDYYTLTKLSGKNRGGHIG